ncbi:MAG: hypothetical protein FJX21_04940 [Alphaproteobacteria bacterium]|nr:hypothetical protein [Alphaproteobacteria bacterium]MBM3886144.1 hypothetical protein [Gemmatimonadota bacterium]
MPDAPPTAAQRAPYRWRRRDGDRVVTIEDALRERAGEARPAQEAVDPRRAASEQRARGLEETVEALRGQMARLEETLHLVGQRSRHFERSYMKLKAQVAAGQAAAPPRPASDDANRDSTAALYARVGLSPDAPDFVIEGARRAFARRFHPDSAASRDDPEASSAEFRYFMRVFDVLQERRKRSRP